MYKTMIALLLAMNFFSTGAFAQNLSECRIAGADFNQKYKGKITLGVSTLPDEVGNHPFVIQYAHENEKVTERMAVEMMRVGRTCLLAGGVNRMIMKEYAGNEVPYEVCSVANYYSYSASCSHNLDTKKSKYPFITFRD